MTPRRTRGEPSADSAARARGRRMRPFSVRAWMLAAGAVIVASVVAIAVQGSREAARESSPALIPHHPIADAERLVGTRVIVTGEVNTELPGALVMREPNGPRELLVVVPGHLDIPVDRGERVWVDGVVERFNRSELPGFGAFDNPVFARFYNRAAIVASAVYPSEP